MNLDETQARALARRLLKDAGWSGEFSLEPMAGGRNNRVFQLRQPSGRLALLKCYFHHAKDTRDRLAQEFAFLRYARSLGCAYVAEPYAADPASHAGLMEYIVGDRPALSEVDAGHIDHAIRFFREMNARNDSNAARRLPRASEACFSIDEHVATTRGRVERLSGLVVEDDVDREAARFVREELEPVWGEIQDRIAHAGVDRVKVLPGGERCLSASDFGFHNSLRAAGGRLRFVDFEYAGWDDPAKLINDFANQPDMLLDTTLSDQFKLALIADHAAGELLERRVELLRPVYQLKWSCICLNEFLGVGRTRGNFSGFEQGRVQAGRKFQLARARVMLGRATRGACPAR